MSIQNCPKGGENSRLIKVWIDATNSEYQQIASYDQQVLESTLKNNAAWFPNALEEQQIRTFFRPALDVSFSTMILLVSEWQQPLIYRDGQLLEEILLPPQAKNVNIEIEAEGVCFFKKRFGVRWIVKRIWCFTEKEDEDVQEEWMDREVIHQEWLKDVEEFKAVIARDRSLLRQKEEKLDQLEKAVETLWQDAKTLPDLEWNKEMEKISKIIHKYSMGTLDEEFA